MSFIIIPRWDSPDGFQHYKDRDPKWIKVYTRLLDDDAYLSLTATQRAVLHGLWLMYAKSAGRVPEDTSKLSRRLGLRVTKQTLDALNHAGFIEFSLAESAQVVSLEQKREEKKELGLLPSSQSLLGEFIDDMRLRGVDLPNRVKGQTAQAVKALLDEGQTPDAVRAGLSRMAERRIVQPSLLPNFVAEAGLPRPEVGRYGRGMTTQQIIEQTRGAL